MVPADKEPQFRVELYGWDAHDGSWYGPVELIYRPGACAALIRQLHQLPGSWYGKLRAQLPGQMPLSFCASVHDVGDAGLAVLDLEGSPGGPLEVITVLPAHRRPKIRTDFAFEFVSFLKFHEGLQPSGVELAIHDHLERALGESEQSANLVFSVETRFVDPEVHMLIAQQVERVATSMIAWMMEKDAAVALAVNRRTA